MADDVWKFRTIGTVDPDEHLYVGHGVDFVLLCERGDLPRWKNAIPMTADQAERLGVELIKQADRARQTDPERTDARP